MNITIKGTRLEITEPVRTLIEGKFAKLDKVTGRAGGPVMLSCEVEQSIAVERAGAEYRAEGNLTVDGKLFRAEGMSATLEGAIDKVRDELLQEFKKSRGKERGLMKRGGDALKQMLRFGGE